MKLTKRLLQVINHDTSGLFSDYFLDDLRSGEYSLKEIAWAFRKGFAPSTVRCLRICESNVGDYLSEKSYFAGHPYNRWSVLRVNDKLTYKYALAKYDEYLPEYYFLLTKSGEMRKLPDCPEVTPDLGGFISLLSMRGSLAVKRLGGCGGEGFYLVEKSQGGVHVNGRHVDLSKWFSDLSRTSSEYVITAAVIQHSKYHSVWPSAVHCIRLQTATLDGEAQLLFGFIRFGCAQSMHFTGHAFGGSVFGDIDIEKGTIGALCRVEDGKIAEYSVHPDTGVSASGLIPNWNLISDKLLEMHRYLADLDYLGWDVAVTEDGFKVLEVNSLTGLRAVQYFRPALLDQRMKSFFMERGVR